MRKSRRVFQNKEENCGCMNGGSRGRAKEGYELSHEAERHDQIKSCS
jgi:hypothetical protein